MQTVFGGKGFFFFFRKKGLERGIGAQEQNGLFRKQQRRFFIQHVNQPFYGSFRVGQILFPEGCGEQEGIDGSFTVRPVLVFLNKKFS